MEGSDSDESMVMILLNSKCFPASLLSKFNSVPAQRPSGVNLERIGLLLLKLYEHNDFCCLSFTVFLRLFSA